MPTGAITSLDETSVTAAVRGILETVAGIGKVADRVGAVATWRERPRAKQAYTEVMVASTLEALQASDDIDERAVVQAHLWMPWSYSERTEPAFTALCRAAKDALRTARWLGGTEGQIIDDAELPQMPVHEVVPFSDGQEEQLCHHAVLVLEVSWQFRYTWS